MGGPIVRRNRGVSQEILDIFPKLFSAEAKVRLTAAAKLSQLIIKEKEKGSSDGLLYSLERLIKGTMSTKDSTKIGSTVLLTEILHSMPAFQVTKLLEMSKDIIGDISDELSEEKVTAWTLIFTAIVQSGHLDISIKKTLKELIRFMVQLGSKKPMCNVAVCNLFEKLFARDFDQGGFAHFLNSSLELGASENSGFHPFNLYIMLLLHKHPKLSRILDKLPPVDLDEPENLAICVKESVSYLPAVHPACVELFHHLMSSEKMEAYWKPVFNDTFFSSESSADLHRLGFETIASILPFLDESNASMIFSKQMMNLWMQCLSNRNHRLHNVANKLGDKLVEDYKDYSVPLQIAVIILMTENPGTVSFDSITRTDIVNKLYIETKEEAVDSLVDRVIQKIRDYQGLSARDKMRTCYIGQLRDLLKSSHLAESSDLKVKVLSFFLTHGFFNVSNDESMKLSAPLTEGLREKMQIMFYKCLGSSIGNKLSIIEDIALHVLRLRKAEIPFINEKVEKFWKKVKKERGKLKKIQQSEEHDKQLKIFKPLLYGVALCSFQSLTELDELTATFEELGECLRRSLGEIQEEDEPQWPDVLLDIMVSQFSRPSVFMANLMTKVFRLFVRNLTQEGIEQLKVALLAQKLSDGDQNSTDDEEEEEDQDVPGKEKSEEQDGSEDDDSASEEGEDDIDEDEEEDTVDDEFRAKVRLALGPAANLDDEGSDVNLDDEEMFQLDEALAEAFRTKYAKEDKKSQETLRMLRLRCLDLVEMIFKSKHPSLKTILDIVPTLLESIRVYGGSKDSELRSKVSKVLIHLPTPKNFKSFDSLDLKLAQSLFKKAIGLAWKIDDQSVQKGAARTCLWVISLSKFANFDDNWVCDPMFTLLDDFFNKPNCCISSSFLTLMFQSQQILNRRVLEALKVHVFSNLRLFKKMTGLSLMSVFLKHYRENVSYDKNLDTCLLSIRGEIVKELLAAIAERKSALLNEYFLLLYILSKFIPLNLSQEEIKAIDKMNLQLKQRLSKIGKSSRRTILSSVQKTNNSSNDSEPEKMEDAEDEKIIESDVENESDSKADDIQELKGSEISPTKTSENDPEDDVSPLEDSPSQEDPSEDVQLPAKELETQSIDKSSDQAVSDPCAEIRSPLNKSPAKTKVSGENLDEPSPKKMKTTPKRVSDGNIRVSPRKNKGKVSNDEVKVGAENVAETQPDTVDSMTPMKNDEKSSNNEVQIETENSTEANSQSDSIESSKKFEHTAPNDEECDKEVDSDEQISTSNDKKDEGNVETRAISTGSPKKQELEVPSDEECDKKVDSNEQTSTSNDKKDDGVVSEKPSNEEKDVEDEDNFDFNIPRVEVVKTPRRRLRSNSSETPTPLRRSLRNRK